MEVSGKRDKTPLWQILDERNPCLCGGVVLLPVQREILQLIAEGHPVKSIGSMVGLSNKAVEYHLAKLQQKLNTWGIARLTMSAIRNGIIEP
jgi:DNA-binding NarL/FixJ family response regulator